MTFTSSPLIASLPWAVIREEYETTGISLGKLSQRYGLASKTTIARRRNSEGWQRRIGPTATHLALLDVAGVDAGQPHTIDQDGNASSDSADDNAVESDTGSEKIDQEMLRDEADAADILTARTIASLQSARIRHQLKLGTDIQNTGMAIIRRLLALLEDCDDSEARRHIQRLISISPDRETLAGLIKAAADVVDRGIIMERRALGMDMVKGKIPEPEQVPIQAVGSTAIDLVRKLDVSLGLRLRQFAADTLVARREDRQGLA